MGPSAATFIRGSSRSYTIHGNRDSSSMPKCASTAPHRRGQRFTPDPVAAALVADHVAPAAGARGLTPRVAAVGDGSGAGNDDDSRRVTGAGHQRDQRVVDHEDTRSVTDAAHDGGNRVRLVRPVD